MEWSGREQFLAAPPEEWTVPGADHPAGRAQSYGPLTFLRVYQAGHMVPMDQPESASDMIWRFTRAVSFADDAGGQGGVLRRGREGQVEATSAVVQ